MAKKFDDEDGVWRTIGGRRIFIKDGEDLATAMKKSGKFKKNEKVKTEIEEQGKSNRKEVSDKIQDHILEYYDSEDDFIEQMDAMKAPTMWKAGEELARGGQYLIYNGDMSDFLDGLKINPKGKKFSDEKSFDMYCSLVGRESAKLYDRIKKGKK